MDRGLLPGMSIGAGVALCVESLGYVQDASALQSHLEDAFNHCGGGRVRLQLRAFLGSVLHPDLVVAVWSVGGHPEAAGRGLSHPPGDLLGQILRVELVHALDDRLHELARWGVVGVFGDGDHLDSLSPQHGLECDGVLTLSGEAGELPDQDHLEWRAGSARGVQHLSELRPVGDAAALGLVDVLTGHGVSVLAGVVPERPQLGGHRQVHVLAVAGHPCVEGRRN